MEGTSHFIDMKMFSQEELEVHIYFFIFGGDLARKVAGEAANLSLQPDRIVVIGGTNDVQLARPLDKSKNE